MLGRRGSTGQGSWLGLMGWVAALLILVVVAYVATVSVVIGAAQSPGPLRVARTLVIALLVVLMSSWATRVDLAATVLSVLSPRLNTVWSLLLPLGLVCLLLIPSWWDGHLMWGDLLTAPSAVRGLVDVATWFMCGVVGIVMGALLPPPRRSASAEEPKR